MESRKVVLMTLTENRLGYMNTVRKGEGRTN